MNNKNKLKNNFIRIILLSMFLISIGLIINNNKSFASSKTKAEIGGYIAEFSINFARDYTNETIYSWTPKQRGAAYNGIKTTGTTCMNYTYMNKYAVDCVGWVSMAIHQSTGLDDSTISSGVRGFVTPQSECAATNYFEIVSGVPQPGDILIKNTGGNFHVMIYVGNSRIVDSGHTYGVGAVIERNLGDYGSYDKVARITDEGVATINDANLTTVFNGQGSIIGDYDGYDSDYDSNSFKYQGTANGSFSIRQYNKEWLVNSLKEVINWYVGITTYLIRMIGIGWTAVIEKIIDNLMESTTGVEASLTVEKIVNNKVAFLDVNFFNYSTAGGQEFSEDSIMYVIRQNIATWYFIIRTISIIGLLITLIYLGVRLAFSSVGEQKAKYKKLLVSWATSFVIVFFIHYLMIIILKINESLIELVNISMGGGEESLYDSVRASAYAIQASIGWPSFIVYLVLVYLSLKFLFIYFKRFFVVTILTFMAPIIGVLYSIDKIKDNKSKSLSNWLKEYTFNVLIQSVHALLYTLFIGLAMNILGNSIYGSIIALLLINFMLKAEGIFKKIFGIKSGQMKDIDLVKNIGILQGAKMVTGVAKKNFKVLGVVTKPITKPIKEIHSKTKQFKRSDKIEKVKKSIDEARKTGDKTITIGKNAFDISQMEENANSWKTASKLVDKSEEIKNEKKKQVKEMMNEALNTAKGTAQVMAAIPMTVVDGDEGLSMFANAIASYKKGINGYNKDEKYYKSKGKLSRIIDIQANIATAGIYSNARNIIGQAQNYRKKANESAYNTQHEIEMKNLQKKVNKETRKLIHDPNINQKELQKVIEDNSTIVSEDIIFNVMCQIEVSIGNEIIVSVNSKKSKESLYAKVDKMASYPPELNELHTKVKDLSTTRERKVMKIDGKKFEDNVRKELVTMIAKENKYRKRDVTQKQIEDKFKNMNDDERSTMMKKAMFKSTNLTDKVYEEKKTIDSNKTNMNLKNVNEIIDTIKEASKLSIDTKVYKKNFEELVKNNIVQRENIPIENIKQANVDSYIANLSNKELVRMIKIAGAEEGSLIPNKNSYKPEYDKLVTELKMLRAHQVQLKGKN